MSPGGGYEISSDEILFADDTQSNTTTAAPADVSSLCKINTEDDFAGAEGEAIENIEVQPGLASDAAGAEGEAIENIEVQPGLASDAPGYGGADKDDSPSRGGVDAAGLEEHSSNSSNEEPVANLKGYISRRVIISWDLYGGPPGVVLRVGTPRRPRLRAPRQLRRLPPLARPGQLRRRPPAWRRGRWRALDRRHQDREQARPAQPRGR